MELSRKLRNISLTTNRGGWIEIITLKIDQEKVDL